MKEITPESFAAQHGPARNVRVEASGSGFTVSSEHDSGHHFSAKYSSMAEAEDASKKLKGKRSDQQGAMHENMDDLV